ncbi:bifunctional adenosylcobinamide kinase/adenosylcobinamide-phosphate guanylyltransferase [Sporosarcina sp. ACRSM]|uniref:bifunctional adenosylcobinamide kinase/adenosylcobinamide-phosphate guanylyltransferase n=1 Tax=Sporosarcina sp. ACRSM TaxID=2918216 RepID=UPI001EF530F2|nr:bifunctional adenosylcobinamide kinase/adenosylcobinamide-phosphate guanylyltransferase [Sporosarcina sp. ACRSM]
MHIYIGGAHNGKRAYVKKWLASRESEWFDGNLPDGRDAENSVGVLVLAGLEKWLATEDIPEEEAVARVMEVIRNREVIIILTDIGRGIVPIDGKQRQLRDTCGRLYQRLIGEAEEVTRIWYGIPQILKKRGEG